MLIQSNRSLCKNSKRRASILADSMTQPQIISLEINNLKRQPKKLKLLKIPLKNQKRKFKSQYQQCKKKLKKLPQKLNQMLKLFCHQLIWRRTMKINRRKINLIFNSKMTLNQRIIYKMNHILNRKKCKKIKKLKMKFRKRRLKKSFKKNRRPLKRSQI